MSGGLILKRLWVALVALMLLVAACTSQQSTVDEVRDSKTGSTTSEAATAAAKADSTATSTTAATTEPADLGPVASMLKLVPDKSTYREEIVVNDYERALALAGRDGWPDGTDAEEAYDAVVNLLGPNNAIATLPSGFDIFPFKVDEWRTEFGFSMIDTRRDVAAGVPPDNLFLVATDRTPAQITDAVQSDPIWSSELNEVGEEDQRYFTWGDEPQEAFFDRSSAARPLGRGGALAIIDDGIVVRSATPSVVENVLSTAAEQTSSLFDYEPFAAVGTALDEAQVTSAYLTNRSYGVGPGLLLGDIVGGDDLPDAESLQERLDSFQAIPRYSVLGIGHTIGTDVEQSGVVVVVVFATLNAEAAEETVKAFTNIVTSGLSSDQSPWSDLFTVRSSTADGAVATIELVTEQPLSVLNAFYQSDTLFAVDADQ